MAFKGIYWRGRGIVIPGAYSYVDAETMVPDRKSPANVIGAVGICTGGKPNTVNRVTSLRDAVALLRDGDLKRAAELMYNPSSEVNGAGEVVFVRVNAAIQASLAIGVQLDLKSKDYGVHTNFIRMKIEAGTTSGKKITMEHQVDDEKEIQDNLGNILAIQYTGSEVVAEMTIDITAKTLEIKTGAVSPATDLLISVPLDAYPNDSIKGLVDTLDGNSDLTCTLDADADGTMSSALLEAISAQDVVTAAYTISVQVGAIHHYINAYSELVESTLGGTPSGAVSDVDWTNFAGGSEGTTPTTQNWTDAIDKLSTESDIRLVYITAETEAIHLAAESHCTIQSDIKTGKERILVCGGSASETVAQAITRAINLGSNRACLVYPGAKRYNITTGELDTLSPALTAALVVGMAGGVAPEEPLTYKTIKVQGMEKTLTDTEVESLLNKGVVPLRYIREDNIYHVVQSITTWQKDANVIFRKLSGMRIHDYLRTETRVTTKKFIGRVADATAMESIKNAMAVKLDALTRTPQNPQGVLTPALVDGVLAPSYQNLTVTFDGFDWVTVSFSAHPVGEIAYITIEAKLKPAKLSV